MSRELNAKGSSTFARQEGKKHLSTSKHEYYTLEKIWGGREVDEKWETETTNAVNLPRCTDAREGGLNRTDQEHPTEEEDDRKPDSEWAQVGVDGLALKVESYLTNFPGKFPVRGAKIALG